jgi:3-hydroxyisobutyrate dehydrogenase
MRIALGLQESTGVTSRMSSQAVELWQDAADGLAPTADHTEVARWVAETAPARHVESAAPALA